MQRFQLFDIHCHLNDKRFADDAEAVIARMTEQGIGAVVVGTDQAMSRKAVELAEAHENLWAAVGMHPRDNIIEDFDPSFYRELLKYPKVVAVGECGFDMPIEMPTAKYEQDRGDQLELFREHMALAKEAGKPLMIHCRDAYEMLIETLVPELEKGLRAHLHFWSGNISQTKVLAEAGCTFSFDGPITFARDYDEVIRWLPLDKIMAETDAPYVAPVPHRGKRNEPQYVEEIVKKIAEIRGESYETVRATTVENAQRVFAL